ncbi:CRISPR-associated protein Csx18 [Geminocystis sp. GBBB08]|uniref:CRISPR-associated protein Csx18 n=1 Tax=Geminocystis sp. GBBB08 TaxID=2604140 RepID=UPI0027E2E160|nr:CRISPR-associated protein Csx18 [Geminocystis sp. GBBB08]MBL1211542.1 hypothetical protein [Geminocystis sp. GBBB08]
MLISWKGSLIKSVAIAFINGLITLILLLIAPLGLAAVIGNTIMITLSSFTVSIVFDFITIWLLKSPNNNFFDVPYDQRIDQIRQKKSSEIQRQNNEDR